MRAHSDLRLEKSVTGDLLRVALVAGGGRLLRTGLLARAARAAILIDLLDAGELTPDAAGVVVRPVVTPVRSVNTLIAAAQRHPGRSVDSWLRRGPPTFGRLVDDLLAADLWRSASPRRLFATRRYVDRDAARFAETWQAVRRARSGEFVPMDERGAALVALCCTLGLAAPSTGGRGAQYFADRAGRLNPLVRHVISLLGQYAELADAVAHVDGPGDG